METKSSVFYSDNHPQTKQGFSLIEVMVVVVIVGILSTIAYPSYLDHMMRARRTDGQTALVSLSSYMTHYYTENNSYVGATPSNVGYSATSPGGFYTLTITNLTASTYTLNAAPTGTQATDTCGTLTLTHTGVKSPTPATCW